MRKCLIMLIISLSSVSAQGWTIDTIDDSGDIYGDCSIVVDNQNYPHIAYCYRQPLGGSNYNYWVKYARWNGIAWEFQPVETSTISVFATAKLCLDNQNRLHIAYSKLVGDSVQFKYAYYDGAYWQISIIDSFNVHLYAVERGCIDIALSETGVPHISYSFLSYTDSIRGIKYASRSGDSWIIQTVWQENGIPTLPPDLSYLYTTAIDLDNAGYPVIAYEIYHYHPSTIDTGFLYCARFNGQSWKIDTITNDEMFPYSVYSLKVDSSDRIHIFGQWQFFLFYTVKSGDTWVIEWIGGNDMGLRAGDMILDGDKPKVVYSSVMDFLTYAYKVDTLWNYELIDTCELGLYPSIAQDNRGGLHVSCIIWGLDWYLGYAQRESHSIAEKGSQSIAESKTLIEIYPNPAKDVLRVRGPFSEKAVKIYDISGKMVKEIEILRYAQNDRACDTKISLKGINPGIYFLRLGKETKKFTVLK